MSVNLRASFLISSLLLLPAGFAMAGNGSAVGVADGQQVTAGSMGSQLRNATNPNVPGATGRTIVIGNHSTISDDTDATEMQRTGNYEPAE